MSLTPSTMLPLGTHAPEFSLPDAVSGKTVSLKDFQGSKALVVMFICNHCPYVKHVADGLAKMARDYANKPVSFVAICSNDAENYRDDSPEKMAAEAKTRGYTFPYLYDETQDVAKAYRAACTPDFYVFGASQSLMYRGQFDDTRPSGGGPATGKDLREAIDTALAGKPAPKDQRPSVGCNIKWKRGGGPAYA